ncbi:putative vacuolar membrane protein [Symbiodinium microadriaticum]|uniref:Putative vacuolar membrane protein n=1 Tax=Symbiodinium microadriaticum TaxID=2951 RepID=A0A1Q9DQP8_SYMMI|nr:putative vacuolar membrane protein [Symbiodinium microadriaticum]
MEQPRGSPWPVLGMLGSMLLAWLLLERRRAPEGLGDLVERHGSKWLLEVMAGCMDTVTVIMRAVGMAVVLCAEDGMHDYTGLALKHITTGHLVAQIATLAFSNYETPLCTPSIEVLPLVKAMQERISLMAPTDFEAVLASTVLCSSCATMLSGFAMYAIGLSQVGTALRFIPYSVEVSVQAMLGLVLFGLGIEASCGVDILTDFATEPEALGSLVIDPSILMLWTPSMLSALAIYFFTKYVKDSPFTIAVYTFSAIALFHGLRLCLGTSLQAAQDSQWLYPQTEYFPLSKLYELAGKDIVWSSVFSNMARILLSAFIISIVNIACQLAVTASLLPPKVMGASTFDYEMIAQGRSHIIGGLALGFASDFGNDDTLVHRMVGGRFRLSMWAHVVTTALCVLCVDIPKNSLPYVPRFVNGTIVLLASAELLVAGFVQGYALLTRTEFAVVCIASLVTLVCGGQVQAGLFAGMFLAFADAIRNFTRALEQLSTKTEGDVTVVELPNYMFFATAPGIVATIRRALSESSEVILDWEKVRGLDTKATLEFAQLCAEEQAEESRGILTFTALEPSIRAQLVAAHVLPAVPEASSRNVEMTELPARRSTALSGSLRRQSLAPTEHTDARRLSGVTALRRSIVLPTVPTGSCPREARSLAEALAEAKQRLPRPASK